jgi:small subunit ribosomal protein S17
VNKNIELLKLKKHTHKMEKRNKKESMSAIVETEYKDKNCPFHGNLKLRGRIFEGYVIKKFHKRVVIEFERVVYVKKYERYKKSKTKIHVRLPECFEKKINIGDLIRVQECRPLSKIVHYVIIKKIKSGKENGIK